MTGRSTEVNHKQEVLFSAAGQAAGDHSCRVPRILSESLQKQPHERDRHGGGAGISKSLLFHYFQNKKELYLFLWDKCAAMTIAVLTRYGCYGQGDLFESMERGVRAKMEIIRQYPDMANFTIRAFYEKDPEISAAIQESYHRYFNLKADRTRVNLDPAQFIPGLDIPMMYREMYWASERYLWEMVQRGNVDMKQMERDFTGLIAFWKKIYLRKEDTP